MVMANGKPPYDVHIDHYHYTQLSAQIYHIPNIGDLIRVWEGNTPPVYYRVKSITWEIRDGVLVPFRIFIEPAGEKK